MNNLDDMGYTCYFTGDRYGTSRLLVQITGYVIAEQSSSFFLLLTLELEWEISWFSG